MNWRAWGASIALHTGMVGLLLGLAPVDSPVPTQRRWEVKLAVAPEPPPPPILSTPDVLPTPPALPPVAPPPAPVAKAIPKPNKPALVGPVRPKPVLAALPPPKPTPPVQPKPKPAPPKVVAQPRKAPKPPVVADDPPVPRRSRVLPSPSIEPSPRPARQEKEAPWRASPPSERWAERDDESVSTARKAAAPSNASSTRAAPPEPDRAQAKQLWYAALNRKLREMRSYPPVARRLGQEGVVTMAIEIGSNGELRLAEVHQSSGSPVLDQAAKRLVQEAIAALHGQLSPPGNSRLEVPVAYHLN